MSSKHVSRKRPEVQSAREREKSNPGVPSAALKPWRDTLARWLSVVWLIIGTVCRFSWQQWQTVRRVFWSSTLVGGNSMLTKHGSTKRADDPSVREREKFPVQWASGGGLVRQLSLGLVEWVTGLLRSLAKNQVPTKSWRFAMLLLTVVSITAGGQSAWAACVGCGDPPPPSPYNMDYYVWSKQPDCLKNDGTVRNGWENLGGYNCTSDGYGYTITDVYYKADRNACEVIASKGNGPCPPKEQGAYTGQTYSLQVSTTGSGQVTENFTGSVTAIPNSGHSFIGWSGDCAGMSFTTSVTMDKKKVCTANFYPIPSVISGKVFNDTNGNGIKDANETGVAGWAVVAEAFVNERNTDESGNKYGPTALTNQAGEYILQNLSLPGHYAVSIENKAGWTITTPNPAEPFDLLVWRTADGTLQYEGFTDLDFGVTPPFPLTVTNIGTGSVKSTDGLINCGSTCQGTYAINKPVSLQATAGTGFKFDKWTGTGECNNSTANPITVQMTAAKTCTANFVCSPMLSVSPTSQSLSRTGGSFKATINVGSCSTPVKWTASSNSSWLTVSPTSGTGNQTLNITARLNPIPRLRTGTITVTATGVTGSPQNIVVRQ